MNLRPYQSKLKSDVHSAWAAGHQNVLAVLPTGGGKTVIFSSILAEQGGACVAIVHRSELVSQISLTLARNGVRHRVIGTPALSRMCTQLHISELKRNFIDQQSRCAVASVDTLVRQDGNLPWFKEVRLWIIDEAAHICAGNKWGDAIKMFPNARGLGVTATPCRADGKGLGRSADGVMDEMILGPSMRDLVLNGWLTKYRIFCPPTSIDMSSVTISANGDYSPPKLAEAVHKSHIVGDVVQHYKKFAMGKLCAAFCVDVEAATEMALAFRTAGIPSEVISGKTPDILRQHILARFRVGEVKIITSVDILSEGFDMPAIEAIIMARPTQSFGLFAQQMGRALRPMDGKTHALIIDAVGNTIRHGLVDAPRAWSLDRAEKRGRSNSAPDGIPLRTCLNEECLAVYERILLECPHCGRVPVIAQRGSPELVDGDLCEMSEELLARLRGEIAATERLAIPYGATPEIVGACKKRHRERTDAQTALRDMAALWGGWRVLFGESDAVQQRRFFHTFGIDCMSMQALGKADALALMGRIAEVLRDAGVYIDEAVSNV
jgi:superfamily II DNA or RNA helicase